MFLVASLRRSHDREEEIHGALVIFAIFTRLDRASSEINIIQKSPYFYSYCGCVRQTADGWITLLEAY